MDPDVTQSGAARFEPVRNVVHKKRNGCCVKWQFIGRIEHIGPGLSAGWSKALRPGPAGNEAQIMKSTGPMRLLALLLPMLAVLAACGSSPARPTPSPAAPAAAGAPATQPPGSEYIIGPGDTLRISVLRNPELSAEVPVRPDGRISTPLVNDAVAVGKTPSQLAAEMEKTIGQYVRSPTVNVIVSNPASTYSQVKVVGQAVAPKAVPFRNGMTVLDLVIQVGGLSQFAAGNRAKIIRTEGQSTREIRVRLNDLINKGKVTENVALQPGDILVIPETLF